MATTPEIKTRFTLDGLRQASTGLRAVGRTVLDVFEGIRKSGGGSLTPLDAGLKSAEKESNELSKALKKTEKDADSLTKSISKMGSKGTWGGLKTGALGAGAAFVGLKAKVSSVSAAAIQAAKDSAASLKSISIDAQRIGGSTEDVAVLGYAAELTGTDRDELITQIATISNEFLSLQDNIKKSKETYTDFLTDTRTDIAAAKRAKDLEKLNEIQKNFREAELEARKSSVSDIDDRIKQIQNVLHYGIFAGDYYKALRPGSLPEEHGKATTRNSGPAIAMLRKEMRELQKARDEFWSTQSPQAQALHELEKYGVDLARASQGGVEGLLEISDAFQKVENPSQRARIAMRLFGEDAGVKLIPLLNGGREAIERYHRVLEASGAIATPQDIANAEEYSRAILNLKAAWSGTGLTVSRTLVPDLTRSSVELTTWLIKSREKIAKAAVDAFNDTRVFAKDAFSLVSGNGDAIQTRWLDITVRKVLDLRAVVADVRRQIALLWEGQDTDYKWINAILHGLASVKAFVVDVREQVALLWEGKNSDYAWVNSLRALFSQVKAFALDAWAVVSGGKATDFTWLNRARDQVVAFAKRFQDAFEMLRGVVRKLSDTFKTVLDYLGTDIATLGLFLGLTRLVGLLPILTGAAGLLFKALGKAFALAGATAGAVGAVGGAAGSAAGAAGAAGATAAGLRVAVAGVTTAIGTLTSAAVVLGTTLAAAFMLGQQAAKVFMADTLAAHDKVIEGQTALIRANDESYMKDFLNRRDETSRDRRTAYWKKQGTLQGGWQGMSAAERAAANLARSNEFMGWRADYKPEEGYGYSGDGRGMSHPVPVTKRVAVDLNVAGRTTTLEGDEVSAMQLARTLEQATRGW
ncbi:hypothetical protein [Hoeflea olei]|uniref:Uncharacterized protein n=1 Tax=Hoeflea olei TaxID=1480615 RepID=A0A1C1YS16_9HYPH|nr:hypothetical protein [Hoeflea olei]OCW56293.1 hypothetical protein AWJ14_19555 [Hoeflea olei]